jgi:hypothetical protein
MADLKKEDTLWKTLTDYRASLPTPDNDSGEKPFDWTKIKDYSTSPFYTGVTYTKVLCKDGTTKTQTNDPNARVMDACRDNGGRAENQTNFVKAIPIGQTDSPQKGKEDTTKKLLGAYNKNLIIAVVLVAGYFAYKKFKK